MRENIFGILEPLCHLCVVAVECLVKWHSRPFTFFVYVCYISVLGVQQNLSVVLEIYLNNFVAQPEHNGMFRSHPFLHID